MMMMMIRRFIFLFLLLGISFVSYSQKDDFGLWFDVSGDVKLVKKLELDLSAELRTFQNASKVREAFLEAGLTYKFNKYISASGSYRFTEFLEKDDSYHPRHKWFADITGKLPLWNFNISGRVMFQQRFKTYYKNENDKIPDEHARIKLEINYNIPSFPVNPFIASEIFFPVLTDKEKGIDRLRLMAGLEYKISKRHSVELEYIYQRDYLPHINDINVISLNYKFKF